MGSSFCLNETGEFELDFSTFLQEYNMLNYFFSICYKNNKHSFFGQYAQTVLF